MKDVVGSNLLVNDCVYFIIDCSIKKGDIIAINGDIAVIRYNITPYKHNTVERKTDGVFLEYRPVIPNKDEEFDDWMVRVQEAYNDCVSETLGYYKNKKTITLPSVGDEVLTWSGKSHKFFRSVILEVIQDKCWTFYKIDGIKSGRRMYHDLIRINHND